MEDQLSPQSQRGKLTNPGLATPEPAEDLDDGSEGYGSGAPIDPEALASLSGIMAGAIQAARDAAKDAAEDTAKDIEHPGVDLEALRQWLVKATDASIPVPGEVSSVDGESSEAGPSQEPRNSRAGKTGRGGRAAGQPPQRMALGAMLTPKILDALNAVAEGREQTSAEYSDAMLDLARFMEEGQQDSGMEASGSGRRDGVVPPVRHRTGNPPGNLDVVERVVEGGRPVSALPERTPSELERAADDAMGALGDEADRVLSSTLKEHVANWTLNLTHVGARHGLWAWFAIFLRELAAVGVAHGLDGVAEETKNKWAIGLMSATFAVHIGGLAYTRGGGTARPQSTMGHGQNMAAMVAAIITAAKTKILAPMAPIAAKAMVTAGIRDTGTLVVGLDNNLGGQKEPSFLSMTIDSVIYAAAQGAVGIPFYKGVFLSGNDPASLHLTFRENVVEAAKFATFLCIPEFINGLTYPLTTALWGTVLDGVETVTPAWFLKLRMKAPKLPSSVDQVAQHYMGVALARIDFIIMVNAFLIAADTNETISPDKLGKGGYIAVTALLNAATCFFLYYPWIWQCMTKAPPEGNEAGFRMRRLPPSVFSGGRGPSEEEPAVEPEPEQQEEPVLPPPAGQQQAAERERRRQEIAAAEQQAITAARKKEIDDEAARQAREAERQAATGAKQQEIAATEQRVITAAEKKAADDEAARKIRETARKTAADAEEQRLRDEEQQAIEVARQAAINDANGQAEAEGRRLETERQRLAVERQRLETEEQRLEAERRRLETQIAEQPADEVGAEVTGQRRLDAERQAAEQQRLEADRQAATKTEQQIKESERRIGEAEQAATKAAEEKIKAAGEKAKEDEGKRQSRETARKMEADAEEQRLRDEEQQAIAAARQKTIDDARQTARDDEAELQRLDAAATQAAEDERRAIETVARQAIEDARQRARDQLAAVTQGGAP
jgi:hypothetical protein